LCNETKLNSVILHKEYIYNLSRDYYGDYHQ